MNTRPFRTTRRLHNLQGTRPGWYRIENKAAGPAQVAIYDEIGMIGVSADDFLRDLAQVTGDIEVHINSPGGDIFDGISIYNSLRQRKATVSVIVDGLAASAASFISQAASPGELKMAPHSQMMLHNGFGLAIGDAADMRKMASLLEKATENIAGIYADRSGRPVSHWLDVMSEETWFSDQEAVAEGLADQILGQDPPQACWDLSVFRNANQYPPVDPDGDGDDDSSPETDTDHDYWDEDGNQIQDLPGRPMPRPAENRFSNAQADESAWDGGAAMSACASSDDPAHAYGAICAGRRAGDPSKQSSWALPHHKHPGDDPNAAGVRNALARLPQTQGLVNEAAARSHLQSHMSAINPDAGNHADGPGWDLGLLIPALREALK